MNDYTIYCTEEQTKKALELGAPIKIECFSTATEDYWHEVIPTTEQMINWLEEQGFYIRLNTNGCNVEIDFTCILELIGISRKEATLAAIDAALEYLSNQKSK